jgi:hypothetical protein
MWYKRINNGYRRYLTIINQRRCAMPTRLIWNRRFTNSSNNFDLQLKNPELADRDRLNQLLDDIMKERHRGLTLSARASQEFQRWFAAPETPLESAAYVLLSNWFLTKGGDRNSEVAGRCEVLWDALFPCRPLERLSSPEAGRNYVMIPAEFESFWARVLKAQDGDDGVILDSAEPVMPDGSNTELPNGNGVNSEIMRAKLDRNGLHCEVEGSPRALADFLQIVAKWGPS